MWARPVVGEAGAVVSICASVVLLVAGLLCLLFVDLGVGVDFGMSRCAAVGET